MTDSDSIESGETAVRTRREVLREAGPLAVGAVAATSGCVGDGRDEGTGDESGAESADGEAGTPLVAHRGFAAEHPENTVAAIEAATAVVDRIELDVRRCGTGELVVFHDATLGRVTDAGGRVDETPYGRLADLSVEGSGEPVPTLTAALDAVPPAARVLLDLKERGIAADALAAGADRNHGLAVTAADPGVIEAVRASDPAVPVAYGVRESPRARLLRPLIPGIRGGPGVPGWAYPPQDVARMVETATRLGCAALSPRYELCLRTDIVARAANVGLRVLPWTVASNGEYEAVADTDVDAIVSDISPGSRGA